MPIPVRVQPPRSVRSTASTGRDAYPAFPGFPALVHVAVAGRFSSAYSTDGSSSYGTDSASTCTPGSDVSSRCADDSSACMSCGASDCVSDGEDDHVRHGCTYEVEEPEAFACAVHRPSIGVRRSAIGVPRLTVPEKQLLRETWFNEVQDAMGDVNDCRDMASIEDIPDDWLEVLTAQTKSEVSDIEIFEHANNDVSLVRKLTMHI